MTQLDPAAVAAALQELRDSQRLLQSEVAAEQVRRQAAEAQIAALEAASSAAPSPTAPASTAVAQRPLVDTRLLGKPEKFHGEDGKWKDWRFVTKAYLVAALPGVADGLERAEAMTVSVLNAKMGEEGRQVSNQLYFALVLLTSSRALDKVSEAGSVDIILGSF